MDSSTQQKLEDISKWYSNQNWGFYTKIVGMTYHSIRPHFVPGAFLEIGPADGEMTRFLLDDTQDLTVVDGAKKYISQIKHRWPNVTAHVSMAEDFTSKKKFQTIILAHVLEHVSDPAKLLSHLKTLLSPKGVLIIVVPNAKSIHRQIGVKMGLIQSVYELNEADISVDHQRVYDFARLLREVQAAKLKPITKGGIFFKVLANKQLEDQWSSTQIDAFYQLGNDYPDLCSEIFVVCQS